MNVHEIPRVKSVGGKISVLGHGISFFGMESQLRPKPAAAAVCRRGTRRCPPAGHRAQNIAKATSHHSPQKNLPSALLRGNGVF